MNSLAIVRTAQQMHCYFLALMCMTILGCGRYIHELHFGPLQFSGERRGFNGMHLESDLQSVQIELTLLDGRTLRVDSITKDSMIALFGAPDFDFDDSRTGHVQRFGMHECSITFVNGEFKSLDVSGETKVTNLENKMTIEFPASEAQLRKTFGNPTKRETHKLTRLPP